MDVLKQLKPGSAPSWTSATKLRAELEAERRTAQNGSQELASLRLRLQDLEAEREAAVAKEREGVRKDVEKILKLLEGAD